MSADLVSRVLASDQRAAGRLMRLVDDRAPGYRELLKALYPHTGRAYVIGITGTPGAGKSTLVDGLLTHYRRENKRVGVLAVDPSSPFTGGAILGDRIRMQRHFLDDQVFIRSLATRGHLGGLSRSAGDVLRVLDAFGCDVILLETVGVGQAELEVARLAHTTVVVLAPGGGDDIQAIKAGILEVADVFAVNKADREGADRTVRDLEGMLSLGDAALRAGAAPAGHGVVYGNSLATGPLAPADAHDAGSHEWLPRVLKTVAANGQGIDALAEACALHREWLFGTEAGTRRLAQRRAEQLTLVLRELLWVETARVLASELAHARERAEQGEDPYVLAESLAARLIREP